ncbi:type IV pilus modification PilV family protein [Rhodoferax ferrireducens]|uniref:type IV pilus modification PilV family protein n=1 Tax=Rhodoferax ferrireducens TaxID=192843 RepID=UPI0018E56DFC|nr:prepilin-type N-terminal cleavage/methylation domain-containing protein [Rhodoferax ferrireducens]
MTKSRQRGFTLIELIIFIVVVSVGLVGILKVMDVTVKSSADPMVRKQTIAIAESLLEEILLKDYANPTGGDTGTVRALFDDVDQYAGYITTGIKDPLGVDVPSLSSYNISPAVTVGTTTLGGLTVKIITVSVTGPQGMISLTGYRGNY